MTTMHRNLARPGTSGRPSWNPSMAPYFESDTWEVGTATPPLATIPSAQVLAVGGFQPVPVESPGGGRIRDKRDPARDDIVVISGLHGKVPIHRLAAQAWTAMVEVARADGIRGALLLPVSGYRSSAHQDHLWRRALARYHSAEQARKWVAPPGESAHQSGRAIDLYLGAANDSANVAKLRQTTAYNWLVANARRFGFWPYDHEPWHWEYNPPATVSAELGRSGVQAGRLEVPSVPVLAGHRGKAPALVLRWNDMASVPAEIDVVVHLHGYSRPWLNLPHDIEPSSGLDLAPVDGARGQGRSRPTLTVLPRGHFTGTKQRGGGLYIYTFPALDGTDGKRDGLTKLVQFATEQFAAAVTGATPRVGRLILTAHSGGGAPLMRMLRFCNPQEVHVFDALYGDAAALIDWARGHIRRDRARVGAAGGSAGARAYMSTGGGALRVFYRGGTRPNSQKVLAAIAPELGTDLRTSYRVEASSLGHWEIPRTYGWRVLADVSTDVPGLVRTPVTHQELESAVSYEQEAGAAPPPVRVDWCRMRASIVASALAEEPRWRRPNGTRLVESDASQLPILQQYWLAVPGFTTPAEALTAAQGSAADLDAFPWSAAFICFVMRGAGVRRQDGFEFSQRHMNYVVGALRNRERSDHSRPFWLVDAVELQHEATAKPGDLLCFNRRVDGVLTRHSYASLRQAFWQGGRDTARVTGSSHCAIVIATGQDARGHFLETIGGNESNSVRRQRVELSESGHIVNPRAHRIFGMIKLVGC